MDQKLRDKLIKAIDSHEWSPPVEEDSFETYRFEAEPCGVFPRYPILGIDGNAIDQPMRTLNQEYKPNMDASRAVDIVNVAIKRAQFDRERFRVKAVQSADGTKVEVYADTRQRNANGQLSTNYQPIRLEDVADDAACAEQLRFVVESMVSGLEHFITDSEVEPDGREDRKSDNSCEK